MVLDLPAASTCIVLETPRHRTECLTHGNCNLFVGLALAGEDFLPRHVNVDLHGVAVSLVVPNRSSFAACNRISLSRDGSGAMSRKVTCKGNLMASRTAE
jgi:hypothetical protein